MERHCVFGTHVFQINSETVVPVFQMNICDGGGRESNSHVESRLPTRVEV